ncbi:MAG: hypothetical protein ACRC92_26020 [Peptostreptococcaceae bacterium]
MDYRKLLVNVGTCQEILNKPIADASRPVFDYFFEKLLLLVDVDNELDRNSGIAVTSVTVPFSERNNIFKLPKDDYTQLQDITREYLKDRGYKLKLIMQGIVYQGTAIISCRKLPPRNR